LFEITIFCSIYVFFFLLSASAAHRHSPALERSVVTILYVFQALLAAEDGRRWLLFSDNTPTMSLATSVYITTYENATVVEQLNDTDLTRPDQLKSLCLTRQAQAQLSACVNNNNTGLRVPAARS
jgi:hypothetical protein